MDRLFEELRQLSAQYEIKVFTAQQYPRPKFSPFYRPGAAEQITASAQIIMIDYTSTLNNPKTLDTDQIHGRLSASTEGAPDAALRRLPRDS
jgi:hypothetical protein